MEQKHRREKKMCPIHYGRKTRKERERHEERERERRRHRKGDGTATWRETQREQAMREKHAERDRERRKEMWQKHRGEREREICIDCMSF